MHIAAILRKIDDEIGKLQKARQILLQCFSSEARVQHKPAKKAPRRRPEPATEKIAEPVVAEVQVTVVPPKERREYQRRPKAIYREARALDAAISEKPVVVPRATTIGRPGHTGGDAEDVDDQGKLEAAVRRNLLGAPREFFHG